MKKSWSFTRTYCWNWEKSMENYIYLGRYNNVERTIDVTIVHQAVAEAKIAMLI